MSEIEKIITEVYAIANNAIYFNDNSDYLPALYDICKAIRPNVDEYSHGQEFLEEVSHE